MIATAIHPLVTVIAVVLVMVEQKELGGGGGYGDEPSASRCIGRSYRADESSADERPAAPQDRDKKNEHAESTAVGDPSMLRLA